MRTKPRRILRKQERFYKMLIRLVNGLIGLTIFCIVAFNYVVYRENPDNAISVLIILLAIQYYNKPISLRALKRSYARYKMRKEFNEYPYTECCNARINYSLSETVCSECGKPVNQEGGISV